MIWIALTLLAAASVAPLAWTLHRAASSRGRREADIALHKAQLQELDRDLAEGRIAGSEHATAVLEVQRRLLAAAESMDSGARGASRWPVIATAVAVPLAALLLYLPGAAPNMPAEPLRGRMEAADARMREIGPLIDELRKRVQALDPKSERAREGYILLGNVEDRRGNLPAAEQAWHKALEARFDPGLAAQVAEAMTRVAGRVTPEARALFRQALAQAPADAPWKQVVEQRLGQATP